MYQYVYIYLYSNIAEPYIFLTAKNMYLALFTQMFFDSSQTLGSLMAACGSRLPDWVLRRETEVAFSVLNDF